MSFLSLPVVNSEAGLIRYLREIKRLPKLSAEEEYMLAKRLSEHQDVNAAHQLVSSQLSMVAKIAYKFRGYGMPMMELISEGNIGLLQAVKRFNPDLGYRLSTYAVWWIKASIQEYILRSWSLVKIGTTAAQKKLFFNLNKLKRKILHLENNSLSDANIKFIADELQVSEQEVAEMESRMKGSDISLNSPLNEENDNGSELLDLIPETRANQEVTLANSQESQRRKMLFNKAMETLSERERHILYERRLKDNPSTLDDLSKFYNLSRERIRQIEEKVIEKLQNSVLALSGTLS